MMDFSFVPIYWLTLIKIVDRIIVIKIISLKKHTIIIQDVVIHSIIILTEKTTLIYNHSNFFKLQPKYLSSQTDSKIQVTDFIEI